MTIPPHRAPGDIGHIDDHNAIVDVLTEHQTDLESNTTSLIGHLTATDPHGARSYADETKADINHGHSYPVTSVNALTGEVVLTAVGIGAETPSGAQAKVDALGATVIPLAQKGATGGVASLDATGRVPLAQIPPGGDGTGATLGWENVSDYGAVGDGTADDTAAVEAAITAALAGTYKRPVYFPPGDYRLTAPIVLQDGLSLLGEMGHGKEFDRRTILTNTATDMFTYGGTGASDPAQRPKDMVFQGITFSGDQTHAFLTPSAEDASGAYPQDLSIIFCGIKSFTTIFSGPALRLKIVDCYLNNCTSTPLNVAGSDNHIVRNFIDSYIAGSHTTNAVVILNYEAGTFSQNYVTCAPQMGIKIRQHSTGLRVVDNTVNGLAQAASHGGFTASEGPGIYVANGANGVAIIGNVVANTCQDPWSAGTATYDGAITIMDASDITVVGNTIYNVLSPLAYHVRIRQLSGTVNRIKVVGNVYTVDAGSEPARIAEAGTLTNIYIDEEQISPPVTSVNFQTGDVVLSAADVNAVPETELGVANGVATLDATGKVPDAQLPAGSGGGGTITPRPALAVVYASGYPSGWRAGADTLTFVCDGIADQTEINNAINAVAAQGGGDVLLAGYEYHLTGSVLMKTGVYLRGGGFMTELQADSGFNDAMIRLADMNVHMTMISDMYLNGRGNNVHGIWLDNTSGDFGAKPSSSPDAAHVVERLFIRAVGSGGFAGHGIVTWGVDCRANKFSDIRILDARGCGVWVDGPDSHFTNIEVGASGTGGPAVSWSQSAPVGHGFFVTAGNNMFTNCKAYYSRGDGFVLLSKRCQYANCQAQDNYGYGFLVSGRVSLVGCHADSNGQAQGASGLGRAGFRLDSAEIIVQGCMSYDRGGQGWQQQHGFSYAAGCTNSIVHGVTYDNALGAVTGSPGTGTLSQIVGN